MHVASKLISPCPSGVHSDTPILESPFQSSWRRPGPAALPPPLSVPRNAFLRLCSPRFHCPSSLLRRVGAVPARLARLPLGPRGDRRLQGGNAGLWRWAGHWPPPQRPTAVLWLFITLPPCLRVSRQPHFHNRIFCRPEKSG